MSDAVLTQENSSAVEQARVDLAAAHRLLARDGFNEGTWNHLSVTVPGDATRVLITPRLQHWSTIRASDLAIVGPDEDGDRMKAENRHLYTGYRIHYPLHMARPDAACVMHAHTPYASAIAMVEDGRLEPAHQNALRFCGRVSYSDEYDAGVAEIGLDQGEMMARALGDSALVLFLRNHGVVVVGPTIAIAYTSLYLLERACQMQCLAQGLGKPLVLIPEHRRHAPIGTFEDEHFAAMRCLLDVAEPDYAD